MINLLYVMECVQKMRNAVIDHLNNYAESVCIDCGFVHRDCKCADVDRRHSSSTMTFLGNAVSVKDSGMQTEPMIVVGVQQQKVNTPGFSVFVPQNFHLSPDVRMPLTAGQPNALTVPSTALSTSSVNVNSLTPSIINLPPTLTFPGGYPPTFVNPLSLPTSASTQSCVSVLRPPLLAGANVPISSSIVIQAPNSSLADMVSASRKRKLDGDGGDDSIADASVQTTGKSYVKKMKLRMGSFSASDFKIVARDGSLLNRKNSSTNASQVAAGSDAANSAQAQTGTGETAATNTTASPGGRYNEKKDAETPVEKRYATVWKLLEDSSDDESAPDKPASTSQNAAVTAVTEENSGSLQTTKNDNGPSCTEPVVTHSTPERVTEQSDSVAATCSSPVGKEHDMLHHNDHPMEQDEDHKLVIDTHASTDDQQSELESKSTVLQQSNEWQFRNGMKEGESADDETEVNKSANDGEQPEAVAKTEAKDDDDGGGGKPSTAANDVDKCVSTGDDSDTSKVPADTAGTSKAELSPKPKRVYGKFEYTPTGEHILRCLVPKCSQTFDRKMVADVHNHVHPGFVPGTEGSEGPTYLQCHRCEFQAPFYHWYDLLRHMRQKHEIALVDSTTEHTCEYCGLGFETKELLVSHIDFHYSNRYKCIYCGLLLLTWGQVTYSAFNSYVSCK